MLNPESEQLKQQNSNIQAAGDEAKNQNNETEYNEDARPPDIRICELHAKASRFAINLEGDTKDLCPCCGVSSIIDELDVCCSKDDLNFNGAGIPLYFEFIIFSISLLLILLIPGLWQLITNINGNVCNQYFFCEQKYFNILSLCNRDESLNKLSAVFNFLVSIGVITATIYYRRILRQTSVEIDNANINASDFSVIVSDIPRDATEDEIRKFFSYQNGKSYNIKKICMGYTIDPYLKIQSQKDNKEAQLTKLMEQESVGQQTQQIQILQSEIKKLESRIQYFEDNFEKAFGFSGVCFISYNTQAEADQIRLHFQMSKIEILFRKIISLFTKKQEKKFRGHTIYIEKAPEPGDILWENLGVELWDQYLYRILTEIAQFFVLSACFGIILGITIGQNQYNQSTKQKAADNNYQKISTSDQIAITLLGLTASISISLINIVLGTIIQFYGQFERHITRTSYNISVTKKLAFAQFMNTAIITLIVNLIQAKITMDKEDTDLQNQLWKSGGLNQNVTLIFFTNSTIPIIFTVFDPFYMIKLYKKRQIYLKGKNCPYTQKQANEQINSIQKFKSIFAAPSLNFSKKYAQVLKTLLLSFFYAYMLPIGVPIAIVALSLQYWVEKILLLRRDSKPKPLGEELGEEIVNFYIELLVIFYSVGCIIWQAFLYDGRVSPLSWVQLGLSIFNYVFPIEYIFKSCLQVQDAETRVTYEESRHQFWDDYDRQNPITMENAVEKWLKEREENQKHLIQKEINSQTVQKYMKQKSKFFQPMGMNDLQQNIQVIQRQIQNFQQPLPQQRLRFVNNFVQRNNINYVQVRNNQIQPVQVYQYPNNFANQSYQANPIIYRQVNFIPQQQYQFQNVSYQYPNQLGQPQMINQQFQAHRIN